jgi:N utilization substance protein A
MIRQDLIGVAEVIAREKNIDREEVFEAMELALQKAARARYGVENDIRVQIDRTTGEIIVVRIRAVTDQPFEDSFHISVEDARAFLADPKPGDEVTELLPPIALGRVAAQAAKQVVVQRMRDAEQQRQYQEYKDRLGDIINGLIRRVEYGNVYIDLGRGEALLRRDEQIPRENLRVGDRVRAYIADVREEARGPQVFLSRTHNMFMVRLFAQEVPEIYDGIIEVKAVARDPGSRAKIAVNSRDTSIDPVGACVGMRGSRVQAVVSELQGEKIDIIPWSANPATFVVNALAPAEVMKVVMDEDAHRIEVVVPDDQLSLAIGRRGQNVRLASMLTGWTIDILTENEESDKRMDELKSKSKIFMDALDVDEVVSHLLVGEGFSSVDEIANVDLQELSGIEGFDESLAEELQMRAKSHLEKEKTNLLATFKSLGGHEDLQATAGLTAQMLVKLAQNEIRTLDDFAGLDVEELIEIVGADAGLDAEPGTEC